MENKHTPGPWRVGNDVSSDKRLVYLLIHGGKGDIASTGVYGKSNQGHTVGPTENRHGETRFKPIIAEDEARANAKLIAAAPDLLAAVQSLASQLTRFLQAPATDQCQQHCDSDTMAAQKLAAIALMKALS